MRKKIKILIVDDRTENLLALKAILDNPGYELISANSGEEALRWVLSEDFAVILLDVQMPGLNGFETAALIHKREKSRKIPIIFITAIHHENEQVIQGYSLGAIDYIFKPVNPETLRYKIDGFVQLYIYREQLEEEIREKFKELSCVNKKLLNEVKQRKKSEAALKESEFRFRKLFLDSIMGISLMDSKGRILDSNPVLRCILGCSEKELKGQTYSDFLYSVNDCEIDLKIQQLVMGESSQYQVEKKFKAKTGLIIWARLYLSLVRDQDGNIMYVTGMFQDITEYRNLQNELNRLDRLNLIGQMSAGIAHEIRNPITTIRGFLQIMKGKSELFEHEKHFDLMIEELDRVNGIITEYLSLARNKPRQPQKSNIKKIIETLAPLISADARNSNKDVIYELHNVPDFFLDEKEIRQLILNLVRNGFEAMEEGKSLKISTYTKDNTMILAVEDEGRGMEQEVIEKLGTPFFTTKETGTGLGLTLCYSIASRHNAIICVDSGNTGTCFKVKFYSL